jgi:predicted HTH domain antitoxin
MMTTDVIVEVRCPADLYQALEAEGLDRAELTREAQEGLAMRLYAGGRVSIGRAARLAGLPLVEFMDRLHCLGLPVVRYGEQELAQDLKTIEALASPARPTA